MASYLVHQLQPGDRDMLLVYDRQCPFCEAYCRLVRVRRVAGRLRIVDARQDSDVLREITAQGLDIDQGMVLKLGGRLYYGADAIHVLAPMSSRAGWFNCLNYRIFRSRRVSRLIYPVLRTGRNLALKLMGKTRVNNLGRPGNRRF